MYDNVKSFLRCFGFVFFLCSVSFGAGIFTGRRVDKPSGNENYSAEIKRVFDIARESIISERARLDSERENIAGLRNGLERERKRFDEERKLNTTDRADLRRLEYLIDEAIKAKQGN